MSDEMHQWSTRAVLLLLIVDAKVMEGVFYGPPPRSLQSCTHEELIAYLNTTPYGEEGASLLASIPDTPPLFWHSLPWNLQWRLWCRQPPALITSRPIYPALEPLVAELEACLLSYDKEDLDDDEDIDLAVALQPKQQDDDLV